MRLVLGWVSAALQGVEPAERPQRSSDWPEIMSQLYAHRLAALVWPALAPFAADIPSESLRQFEAFRALTSTMNAANLLTMRRVVPAFEAAGVAVVAFKGPVLQQMAYGSVFVRPSSDLDLLVAGRDFHRAAAILEQEGYALAAQCRSLWWRACLGEQHFLNPSVAAVTVDLHHRVQQPGAPMPRDISAFVKEGGAQRIGGSAVPTLSHHHAVLLSAMSFVKALHHREPAARYLVDLIALSRKLTPEQAERLGSEARRQGLVATVALAGRGARLLGGAGLPIEPESDVLPAVPDRVLMDMIMRPDHPEVEWPRRRTLLRALFDRGRDYPAGLSFMVGSEAMRLVLEPRRSAPMEG